MTFKIFLPVTTYEQWVTYRNWNGTNPWEFSDLLLELHHDEVLKVSDYHKHGRTFIFKSEQHYHWFLLQQ